MRKGTESLEVTTPTEREFVITRAFDAPRELVFEAWTQCEHLKRWMLGPEGWTMPICEIDPRPGGAMRFVWSRPGGQDLEIRGTYLELVPPERIVSTESWGEDWPETTNTLVLTENGGRTTSVLTITYPSKQARDAAIETGAADGMELGYQRLDELLLAMKSGR